MADYFDIEAVSNSFMGQVRAEALGQPPMNQRSPALRYGSNIHELILEPEKYNIRNYSGKERMEAMTVKNAVIQQAGHLLDGIKEQELFYDFHGWQCKMKADIINQDEGTITDLKTTATTNLEAFRAAAIDYGYNRQAAWYLDAPPVRVMNINRFRIIAVSKIKPHEVFIWELAIDHPLIKAGREEYMDTLEYMSDHPKYIHLKSKTNPNVITKSA